MTSSKSPWCKKIWFNVLFRDRRADEGNQNFINHNGMQAAGVVKKSQRLHGIKEEAAEEKESF